MRSELKILSRCFPIILLLTTVIQAVAADSIPSGFSCPLQWRLGVETGSSWIPPTCPFLRGDNPLEKNVRASLSGNVRADFCFSPESAEGMLFPGLYQGVGFGPTGFFASDLLGTPVSAFVYQGAPVVSVGHRLWLGYEWKFGAAFGWKHFGKNNVEHSGVVSTGVTAHMAVGLRLHYRLSPRVELSFGVEASHFSNGNTSWPNAGVNSVGASVAMACSLNPVRRNAAVPEQLVQAADKPRWFCDLTAYGAWRKRVVRIGCPVEPTLCPGVFGVAGLQIAPMRKLNRWVAVGMSMDLQWDESAGLSEYWVEWTDSDNPKFNKPPFFRQLGVGVSGHAELTMPVFSINAGLGYAVVSPKGDRRFYQSLTLKTFLTEMIFLNVGYRLGRFKEPQNLMLGIGIRI